MNSWPVVVKGILLQYPDAQAKTLDEVRKQTVKLVESSQARSPDKVNVGFIGSGNYAKYWG